ncbi:MAG: amidase [Candidatus Rokubacteria bacterium]|nr:amidase [Candidatus Rokubacteria bacterium]
MAESLMTASEIAKRIRAGVVSPVVVVEACLARIAEVEPAVLAWVRVDRDGALTAARELEAEARAGSFRGPLHGVPVGVKDIYHVAGMVTTAGAGAFAHEHPSADAETVARLRRAGAVILGKTATTEFAYADPAVTRNPWNPEHTPGGSSSGSAAAVAAGMIPLALGSQTVGSTLRPAAYCGVVGLKPTHGRISAAGVIPLAWSLDHIGIFTRDVEDAAVALLVLAGYDAADPHSAPVPTADYPGALVRREHPPRLGLPRRLFSDKASPEVNAHLEAMAVTFQKAGAIVEEVSLPPGAEAIHEAGQLVMRVEAATFHRARFRRYADSYRPKIRGLIEEGLAIPGVEYVRAQQTRRQFREEMRPLLERYAALLMPVAPTTAPKGLHWTGDPGLCAPWSFTGFPAIALPSGLAPDSLPLAIQLVAGPFAEARLLGVARWCEAILSFTASPSPEAIRP